MSGIRTWPSRWRTTFFKPSPVAHGSLLNGLRSGDMTRFSLALPTRAASTVGVFRVVTQGCVAVPRLVPLVVVENQSLVAIHA